MRAIGLLCSLGMIGVLAGPALAGPFDAPFTGTVDIDVVSLSASGSVPGFGNFSINRTGSSPGTVNVAAGRIVDAGNFGLSYNWGSPLGTVPVNGVYNLGSSDSTVGNQFGPGGASAVSYPLDPTDAIPPSDPVGALSADAKFHANLNLGIGGGVVLNADMIQFDSLTSRTPIPGGEQFVYGVTVYQSVTHPQAGLVILSLGGSATVNATPEPACALLLLAGLPLLRRRR